jgi:pimeloyl-ACP methyl ester carboxylesterase
MNWTRIEVGGKPADVFAPEAPRFGLIYLHGHGLETLADNPVYTPLLAELKLACVCPHGQRSWWVDRVCPEFDPSLTPERHVVDNVLPFCRQRWGLTPGAVGLFGVSMGGQGALRLGFRRPDLFPVVAGISSAIDFHEWHGQGGPLDDMYETREHCRQDTAVLHVHPSEFPAHVFFCIDPADSDWYRGNDRLHEKLSALGIAHEIDFSTRAGGHSWDYFNHMASRVLHFLHAGLVRQSRRLL